MKTGKKINFKKNCQSEKKNSNQKNEGSNLIGKRTY
jgi:hypothetical protein